MTLSELGLYEGKAAAGLALDASIPSPIFAMRAELRGVRALPLLTSAADFTSLDGRMSAQIDVRSTGRNQREMIANLSGTTNVDFQDGEIRGINVAQMIRNLTSSTLSGWQESGALKTDLAELHASFRIEKGKAETSDLRLAGPLVRVTGTGSTDLNTKTLSFRIEPKLVMTTQGQGSTAGRSDRPRRSGRHGRPVERAADVSGHGRHPRQSGRRLRKAPGARPGPVRPQLPRR